jgi:phosphate-selective porin OprO/OprP
MKRVYPIIILFMFMLGATAQENGFNAYWKNGLNLETDDGDFKIKFGGRVHLDAMTVFPDEVIDTMIDNRSGVEFRRLRLYSSGLLFGNIKYKVQLDFAGGAARLKDVYITITRVPYIGNIQIGQFKEPLGLELLTSSNYITMIERSLTNPMFPDRKVGIMLFNNAFNKRFTWSAGYFNPTDDFGKYLGPKYHLTGRLTGLALYRDDDKYRVLHLGAGYSFQYEADEKYVLKTRPESHLLPTIALAEIDHAKNINVATGEVAMVLGSFHVQTEYAMTIAQTSENSALQNKHYYFHAYHGIVSWFITGEHKNYKTSSAAFGRVSPKKNFGKEGGAGAFELAARYSNIDLDDTDIEGGYVSNIGLGLNWYLNPNTRFMLNYIFADIKDTGNADILMVRFQIDF